MGTPGRRRFLKAAGALALLAVEPRVMGRFRLAEAADERLAHLTLSEASAAVHERKATSVNLATSCLARIDRLQGTLNAFITVARDEALAAARARDDEVKSGRWRGPLHGIPIALKDNIDTAGLRTSAASAVFSDRIPTEDAEVVRRLRAAGAVILGKLNMDEFAAGGTSVVTYFKPVHNPWNRDRSAGGSSGGSGVAVAANLCFGALGTDTTGSLRIPAAFCGVVGFKPTYGRVSTTGVIPLSWTLDHVGPMARTVEDAALMLRVIAGHDRMDTASVDVPVPDYVVQMNAGVRGVRVGVPRMQFWEQLDPDVAESAGKALETLRKLADVRDVQLPPLTMLPTIVAEEMYAYHSDTFGKAPDLYQLSTRKKLEAWSKLGATDYILAKREIERARRDIGTVFERVDLLVMPTVKIQPRTIEEAIKRSESEKPLPPELGNTGAFNGLGLPAISVPCGITKAGLPVGLQIVGAHFAEGRVLALAHAYERATEWHTRRPPLGDASP
jgi:aspartyl-tRNA(Asn)/glutamyl-tRNA(Gln) amidotransferase subunit A